MKKEQLPACTFIFLLWTYIITRTTLYVKTDLAENFITCICLFGMMLIAAPFIRNAVKFCGSRILLLYILLIMSIMLPDILHFDSLGLVTGAKYMLPLFALAAMLLLFTRKEHLPQTAFMIPIVFGTIVSVQSLILFVLLFFNVPVGYTLVEYPKHMHTIITYNFFLGTRTAQYYHGEHVILRLASYFFEPAKFAAFLLVPIMGAFAFYKRTGRKIFLYVCGINFVAFLLTFSRAGYVALAAAIVFYYAVRGKKSAVRKTTKRDVGKLLIAVGVAIAGVFLTFYVIYIVTKIYPDNEFLSQFTMVENGKVVLFRTASGDFGKVFELLSKQIYGYGISQTIHGHARIDFNTASAPSFWLYAGGIVSAVLLVILYYLLVTQYCIPCIKSKEPIKISIACLFVALTVQGLSYGNWISIDYLYVVGMMILLRDRDILLMRRYRWRL